MKHSFYIPFGLKNAQIGKWGSKTKKGETLLVNMEACIQLWHERSQCSWTKLIMIMIFMASKDHEDTELERLEKIMIKKLRQTYPS